MLSPRSDLCSSEGQDHRAICWHGGSSHQAKGAARSDCCRRLRPTGDGQSSGALVARVPYADAELVWQLPVTTGTITVDVKSAQSAISFAALDAATNQTSLAGSEHRKSSTEQERDADVARVFALCRIAPLIIYSDVHCWQYMAWR